MTERSEIVLAKQPTRTLDQLAQEDLDSIVQELIQHPNNPLSNNQKARSKGVLWTGGIKFPMNHRRGPDSDKQMFDY